MAPGTQLCCQPPSPCGLPSCCLLRLPHGTWVCPHVVDTPPLLVPVVAGASVRGSGCSSGRACHAPLSHGASFLWRPRLLPQTFPVPGCGLPRSHPYRLFLHSQQQPSTRVCSPNPTFQPPPPPPSTLAEPHFRLGCAGLWLAPSG